MGSKKFETIKILVQKYFPPKKIKAPKKLGPKSLNKCCFDKYHHDSLHMLPGHFWQFSKSPQNNTKKHLKKHPKTPKIPKNTQKYSKTPKNTQKHPKYPKI